MKSVYTGGEKVAEFESYDELRVGENKPAFIYEGDELVYPSPVKDGLVLWYDFSGRTNTDGQRGIAEDLSGNGNHGTLQNFNYTAESGYDKNKLSFDGVDDELYVGSVFPLKDFTLEITLKTYYGVNGYILFRNNAPTNLGIWKHSDDLTRFYAEGVNGFTPWLNVSGISHDKVNTYTMVYDSSSNKFSVGSNGELKNSDIFDIGEIKGNVKIRNLKSSHYSLKVYNRPLTPEEIAHNYAIEKERFNIE